MKLDDLSSRASSAVKDTVSEMHKRFLSVESRPEPALKAMVTNKRNQSDRVFGRIEPGMKAILTTKDYKEQTLAARLDALSPYKVLDRGYSFVAGPDGQAVTSVKGLAVGSRITVRMRDGRALADIVEKEELQ